MKTHILKDTRNPLVHVLCTFGKTEPDHTPRSVCTHLVYEELLFAGCKNKSRERFLKELGDLGSKVSLGTSDGRITLSISALRTQITPTLRLVKQMLTEPLFAQKEILRIKQLLKNQLRLAREDADFQSQQIFKSAVFHKHDPAHSFSIDSLIDHIDAVSIQDIRKVHKTLFAHEPLLSVSGNKPSTKEVVEMFRKLPFRGGAAPEHVFSSSRAVSRRVCMFKDIKSKQNIEINLGNALPFHFQDPAYAPFVFGMSVLAMKGGFSGRLMSTVREREGLTYGIYGHVEKVTNYTTGYWRIDTFFSPDKVIRGIESTLRELRAIVHKGITKEELVRFKSILHTREVLRRDSIKKQLSLRHVQECYGVSEDDYQNFLSSLQGATVQEVNTALKEHLDPSTFVLSAAGPVEDVRKEITALLK